MTRFEHMRKGRKIRSDSTKPHKHPSHPYWHPEGREHNFPPTSRIKDRKGRKFRNTPQERRRTHVKTTYQPRSGKPKRWD